MSLVSTFGEVHNEVPVVSKVCEKECQISNEVVP